MPVGSAVGSTVGGFVGALVGVAVATGAGVAVAVAGLAVGSDGESTPRLGGKLGPVDADGAIETQPTNDAPRTPITASRRSTTNPSRARMAGILPRALSKFVSASGHENA